MKFKRISFLPFFILSLAVTIFALGYLAGRIRSYPDNANVPLQVSQEMREYLAGLSREDTEALMTKIRSFSKNAVQETNQQILYEAMTANVLLAYRANNRDSEIWPFLEQRISRFLSVYESGNFDTNGMDEIAKTIYSRHAIPARNHRSETPPRESGRVSSTPPPETPLPH